MMKQGITNKEARILSITIASCGILLIGSGILMNSSDRTIVKKNYSVEIKEEKIAAAKTNELKLKDMILEINNPLSVNIKDYIENINDIESTVLKSLKLDTSMVNINQAGTYNYTITYKKKKYSATFTIKEKELPKVDLTLKNLSLEKGAALSTSLSTYIVEELSEEVKNNITLNLKDVNTTQPGEYQYTVIYDGKLYTGKIWIYEKQTTIITPNTPEKDNSTNEKQETENTDQNLES